MFINIKAVFSSKHYGSFKSLPITLTRDTGSLIYFRTSASLCVLIYLFIALF